MTRGFQCAQILRSSRFLHRATLDLPKSPLLIWLIFHPTSNSARDLAREVHRQLNGDIVVPGLRIPTAFCPIGAGDRPPSSLRLDFAERNFVVPLADNAMYLDDDWCKFVADVWTWNQATAMRCVPMQLSKDAWPLDVRLEGYNFARAYLQPEGEARTAFVVRRIVVELCRYLSDMKSEGDRSTAPIKLFLSHAKADLNAEPKVAGKFIDALKADQPIEAWVDSGDISAGSQFAKEIANGVKHTSLLAVLTDSYSTREFCREEILLAKEQQRPMVLIDALTKHEARAFPYAGNIPWLRWDGDPQTGIDCLLKETLRCLHSDLLLSRKKQADDIMFVRPPEMLTLVGHPSGRTVLYPDPPIGTGEAKRLTRTGLNIVTPLQRLALDRPLQGRRVALSMSDSTDSRNYPDGIHLEANMTELSRYLLIKGATLVYGGFLAKGGYSQILFELVRAHNTLEGVPRFERILSTIGWPLPRPSEAEQAELKPLAKILELPRPSDVDETLHSTCKAIPAFFPGDGSPEQRFAWARGMTEMRKFQADSSRSKIVARIVLGGPFGPTRTVGPDGAVKERWYSSRIPGVLEEVLLSIQTNQPVFLIGAYGGVARMIIDLLKGKDRAEATWEYQKKAPFAAEMKQLYEQRGVEWIDYPQIILELRTKGIAGINPWLIPEEHEILFETVDPVQIVELVMTGLNRLAAAGSSPT